MDFELFEQALKATQAACKTGVSAAEDPIGWVDEQLRKSDLDFDGGAGSWRAMKRTGSRLVKVEVRVVDGFVEVRSSTGLMPEDADAALRLNAYLMEVNGEMKVKGFKPSVPGERISFAYRHEVVDGLDLVFAVEMSVEVFSNHGRFIVDILAGEDVGEAYWREKSEQVVKKTRMLIRQYNENQD